jgi:hypothetical protein
MQTKIPIQTIAESRTTIPFPGPPIRRADTRARQRRIRSTFGIPRRAACLTRRALLAALREAEFAEWMATGGDYLASMHQPVD